MTHDKKTLDEKEMRNPKNDGIDDRRRNIIRKKMYQ